MEPESETDAERIQQAKDGDALRVEGYSFLLHSREIMQLLKLAEEALFARREKLHKTPTDKERELVLSLYCLVGKEVPPYFSRTFGWRID